MSPSGKIVVIATSWEAVSSLYSVIPCHALTSDRQIAYDSAGHGIETETFPEKPVSMH